MNARLEKAMSEPLPDWAAVWVLVAMILAIVYAVARLCCAAPFGKRRLNDQGVSQEAIERAMRIKQNLWKE